MTPAQSQIKIWKENAPKFVYDNFGVTLDPWQEEAMGYCGGSTNPRRRLAMKACTGPGKSAVLAWIGWHRLACFADKGEHPKGAAISGEGWDNLRDNLWAELGKWQDRSPFLKTAFQWNSEKIYAKDHLKTWFLSARSYPKTANTEDIGKSLAGLHSRYPFILLDEIGAMPTAVGQKATQIFTGGVADGLIAGAGNPTTKSGLLYYIWETEAALWKTVTITADPDDPKRTSRVDVEHAREQIQLHGRDDPWVKATILGLFPDADINALLGIEEVETAMNRHLTEDKYNWVQKRLGVDVARFGDDRTILFPRQGLRAYNYVEMRNSRTQDICARVLLARSKWQQEIEIVDGSGGYGGGVVDALIQAGFAPYEFYGSGKAIDPRYFNKRSETYFLMAEWIKRGGAIPKCPHLKRELIAPKYTLKDGKFKLQEKDQIKKDLKGHSPDRADALSMTFALPDQPATVRIPGVEMQGQRCVTEYDPMAGA